jgi:hypothetical protein
MILLRLREIYGPNTVDSVVTSVYVSPDATNSHNGTEPSCPLSLSPQSTQSCSFPSSSSQLSTLVPAESQKSISRAIHINFPKPVFRNRRFTQTSSQRNENEDNKSGSNSARLSLKKAKGIQRKFQPSFLFMATLRTPRLVTPRIVPEGSDSIQLAIVGDIAGLKRLFNEGTAFASESSEDCWSLLHVRNLVIFERRC